MLALVDAVVLGKDATLSEVFAALWARIGFLARVNASVLEREENKELIYTGQSLVNPFKTHLVQNGALSKAPRTIRTGKGFFIGMDSQVLR